MTVIAVKLLILFFAFSPASALLFGHCLSTTTAVSLIMKLLIHNFVLNFQIYTLEKYANTPCRQFIIELGIQSSGR